MKYKFLILVFLFPILIQAQVKLPSIFTDHMVLQQSTKVGLWGLSNSGKTVTIKPSWSTKKLRVKTNSEGKWKISFQTPAAGGPYTIDINDGKLLRLTDILIGEVWFCSGQSNMEMPLKGFNNQPITNGNEAVLNSSNSQIRLITINHQSTSTLQDTEFQQLD